MMRLTKEWTSLLSLIPGYDPIKTAGDSHFDPKAAKLALDFFPECLKHVEGDKAGTSFILERWEQSYIANLFGWKRKDPSGRLVRRYRESLLFVPRKNGKTPLAAGICLYTLFCDGERGAQIYSAAAEREQAALLYRHAKGMVEQEPELSRRAKVYAGTGHRSIVLLEDEASSYKVISADAGTKHGFNIHLAVCDELHAYPNRELVDVLKTATASQGRKNPLFIYITTADFDRPSICNEIHDYACKVRDGIIEDAAFLPAIYEAARDADWTDPKVWEAANPNLGVSVSREYLEKECARAKELPSYENTFKRLHLNMKTEQDVRAIPMDKWDACGRGVDPLEWRAAALERLKGKQCFVGLDLGSTSDLTALCLLFMSGDDFEALPFFWVPRDSARNRERRDRVPYETWTRLGYVKPTEGDTTDYDKVRADVNELAALYDITELAVDRLFQGVQLCTQLGQDGHEVIAFGQGFFSMAAPTKRMLELILNGHLVHGNNPVLRWMASNAATETDGPGNLKFSKKKSTEKIDGIIAATMALGRAMLLEGESVYAERGIMTLDEEPVEKPQVPKPPESSVWENFGDEDDED